MLFRRRDGRSWKSSGQPVAIPWRGERRALLRRIDDAALEQDRVGRVVADEEQKRTVDDQGGRRYQALQHVVVLQQPPPVQEPLLHVAPAPPVQQSLQGWPWLMFVSVQPPEPLQALLWHSKCPGPGKGQL
jgi:hypothetical protein